MPDRSLKSGLAEVNGAKLYYEVAGAGRPLVLIHAGIADCRMWDDQVPVFAERYQVIRYDLRGAGRSDNPDGSFSYYDDLRGLLDFLGVDKACLIGVSMGGSTALDFALTNPGRVSALITVGSAPSGYQYDPSGLSGDLLARMMELNTEMETADKAGDIPRLEELDLQMWVDGPYRRPNQVDPRVRAKVREMNHTSFELLNAKAHPLRLDPSAVGRLAEITVPTLIMAGALDMPNVLAAVDILVSDIKNAQKVILPGTAHVPNMEQPQEFNRLVLEFLGRI